MTTLIFVRHGQSEGNLHRLFLGHTDLGLTELGHEQAERTAEYLKNTPIDVCYASDLKRAYQTAEHIVAKQGLSIIPEPRLREIYAGKWEGMSFLDLPVQYPETYEQWMHDLGHVRCPDGESVAELQIRIRAIVEEIVRKHPNQTVCLALHATPIRVMECIWKQLPLERITEVPWVPNASVTTVTYDADMKATLILDGYAEHLADLKTNLPKNI